MAKAMQKKTINQYIKGRVNKWSKSINNKAALAFALDLAEGTAITDEAVEFFQADIVNSTIVTGGCIASMLLGEEVNDIDIFFSNKDVAEQVANYYLGVILLDTELPFNNGGVNAKVGKIAATKTDIGVDIHIKSQGIASAHVDTSNYEYFEGILEEEPIDQFFKTYHNAMRKHKDDAGYIPIFITSNAITLSRDIQLIMRFAGDINEIHRNFDFIHATNYWTAHAGVVYREEALVAVMERRLKYIGSLYPVTSIFRLRKFLQRDWQISAGEIVKIAFDTSKLDLSDISVLRDQVMGMDSAYFAEVIALLNQRANKEDPSKPLERTYLFNVIDIVFGDGNSNDEGQIVDE